MREIVALAGAVIADEDRRGEDMERSRVEPRELEFDRLAARELGLCRSTSRPRT